MPKRLIKSTFIIIILLNNLFDINAQNISFFNDYLGNVSIFDNGKIKQIEHQPLKSYKIGNTSMAYVDNADNFKIYHNHFVHNIITSVGEYKVSNNYIAYSYNKILRGFDNGSTVNLSNSISEYFVSDDIIVWFDDMQKTLNAYSGKEFFELDDALTTDQVNEVYIGKNIAAYVDNRNYLNIFYNKEIIPIDYAERIRDIQVGKDIVAFIEEPVNSLQVFYYGESVEVENFEPKSFKAGDSFLAYVDANNYLKVFKDFEVKTISMDNPDFYEVADQLIVYGVQNYFRIFYNGKVFTLENYIPSSYFFHNNVLCYIDQIGNLKYFDGSKVETVSYEIITEFELHGSILKYKFGVNSENIYFNNRNYKND